MSSLMELCSNFARRSGAHGFHDVDWHKKIPMKIFWIIMCCAAWSMFLYQVVIFSIKYYSYPISTKVSVAFSPSAPYPAISFCNLNPVKYSKLPQSWDSDFLDALERVEPELPPLPGEMPGYMPPDYNSGFTANDTIGPQQTEGPPNGPLPSLGANDTLKAVNLSVGETTISPASKPPPLAGQNGSLAPKLNSSTGPKERKKRATKSKRPPPKSWTDRKSEIEGYSDDEQEMHRPYEVDIQDQFYRAFYKLDFETKKEIGHQIEEMLLECIWQERQCFPENFTHFYHQVYGNCYSFNAGWEGDALHKNNEKNILATNIPGPKGGLELVLYVEEKEYVPLIATSTGVRVHIHHQEKLPLPDSSGFTASTGFKTNLEIRKNVINRLAEPYHSEGCEQNMTSAMENMRGRYYWPLGKYSVDSCLKLCYQEELFFGCDCIDPKLQAPPTLTPCDDTKRKCKDEAQSNFRNDQGKVGCRSKCVAACSDIDYTVRSSYALWPNEQYMDILQYGMSSRNDEVYQLMNDPRGDYYADSNLLKVQVYFQKLNYDYITEEPSYELMDFLGDIGGSVGLWVGMSVLAAIQCIEFVLELLVYFCSCQEDKQVVDEGPGRRGRTSNEDDVSYVPKPLSSAGPHTHPGQAF